jgi:nicotinamide riboside kinase
MRIYFTGSHSSGKSTLARYTSEKYKLPFIPEVARQILAEKELQIEALRADISLVNEYQREIFFRQLKEEAKYKDFVSDRGVDCLCYAGQHSTILSELVETKELKDYVVSLKNKDVKIFFVRPSKATLKADGVRENIFWDGIIAIDAMCKMLLEMYSIPYVQINTDSMQERTRLIDNILG